MQHYVYTLTISGLDYPFYVGKGKNDRKTDHFRDARNGTCKNKHLERTIIKAWRNDKEVLVDVVFSTDDEELAFVVECELISGFGRRDLGNGPLVNLTSGGEGVRGVSPDTIKRAQIASAKTRSSRTPEQHARMMNNLSVAGKKFWSNLTEDEKRTRTSHLREWWRSASTEEKKRYQELCKQRRDEYMTAEWRQRLSDTCKELWDKDKRQSHSDLIRQIWEKLTNEEKQKRRDSIKQGVATMWSKLTPDERRERTAKMREAITTETRMKAGKTHKARLIRETDAEKDARRKKHAEGAKKIKWDEVNMKIATTKRGWSEEKKAEYSRKMRDAAQKRWGSHRT